MAVDLSLEQIKQCKDDLKSSLQKSIKKRHHLLNPLIISNCNGDGAWSFCEATINYKKRIDWTALPIYFWYSHVIRKLLHELQGEKSFAGEGTNALKCLFNVACNLGEHTKCLGTLLADAVSEAKVKTVLAIHYFQPLMPNRSYVIDRGLVNCQLCKKKINYGDTSFGNRYVWHGIADIVIHKSVVKVSLKKPDETEKDEDDPETGKPPAKQRKDDSSYSDEEEKSLITIHEKMKNKKRKSQALAQGIVNAFCEAKRDPSLFKKFIPSFLATEEKIKIIMYNCESDVLLLSEALSIWDRTKEKITLDIGTLVQVWLCLNFEQFDINISDFVLEQIPSSNFRKSVGDAYPIYLEKMTRPLGPPDQREEVEEDNYDPRIMEELISVDKFLLEETRKL